MGINFQNIMKKQFKVQVTKWVNGLLDIKHFFFDTLKEAREFAASVVHGSVKIFNEIEEIVEEIDHSITHHHTYA